MPRSRLSEEQVIGILEEPEAGVSVAELCRKHGVSDASIYTLKATSDGMEVSEAKRLRSLEDANAKLRRMLAEGMSAQRGVQPLPDMSAMYLAKLKISAPCSRHVRPHPAQSAPLLGVGLWVAGLGGPTAS